MSFEIGLAILGGISGAYGALQSWLTQRKMKQVDAERLATRLDIDFEYSIIETPNYNLLHGIVSFENKGETNIKIIRLNIDGRDRSTEFNMSYTPVNDKSNSKFTPLSENIDSLELVALNNYKQVLFSSSEDKKEFKIYQPDIIYTREKEPKLREVEDIKGNINTYISEKLEFLQSILNSKDKKNMERELHNILYQQLINKELRGIQIFPNAILKQEFFIKYAGTGSLYLNVETSTIRILQETINYIEEYKVLANSILKSQNLDIDLTNKLTKTIRKIVTPESNDVHKQKESFLLYLT